MSNNQEHHAQPASHEHAHTHAPHTPAPVPPELDKLIAQKHEQQKEASQFGIVGATVKTAAAAGLGAVVGLVGITSVAISRTFKSMLGALERDKEMLNRMTSEEEQKYFQSLSKDLEKTLRREPGLTGSMMRNPGTYITATAIIGGGMALASHSSKHQRRKEQADHEVATLESVKTKWQHREQERKENAECSTCHAK